MNRATNFVRKTKWHNKLMNIDGELRHFSEALEIQSLNIPLKILFTTSQERLGSNSFLPDQNDGLFRFVALLCWIFELHPNSGLLEAHKFMI